MLEPTPMKTNEPTKITASAIAPRRVQKVILSRSSIIRRLSYDSTTGRPDCITAPLQITAAASPPPAGTKRTGAAYGHRPSLALPANALATVPDQVLRDGSTVYGRPLALELF